jgi:hypothetical protein
LKDLIQFKTFIGDTINSEIPENYIPNIFSKSCIKAIKNEKIYWGGFCDNKLNWEKDNSNIHFIPAIFYTKKEAKIYYEDVRKIKVIEVTKD